jgi:hypothetical protein
VRHLSVDRAKRVSNHGSCPYCRRSRTRNEARRIEAAREQVLAWPDEVTGEAEDGFTNYGLNRDYCENT